jgi:ATP-dependent DNA helicase DinG
MSCNLAKNLANKLMVESDLAITSNRLSEITSCFAPDGPIAQHIKNYTYREQQLKLVEKIHTAMVHKEILLAEAGTGTGKTLAYLIPALFNANKVVISTGTKNLQNQLYFRDVPLVVKATKQQVKIALLKGRSNYLCKYRLEIALTDILLATSAMVVQFKNIVTWSEATTDGDTSTLDSVPEDAEVWRYVTSTSDNCLGQECPMIKNCFVYKARQAALEAKIIIVNHHLLLSDWALKAENDEAQLLPNGVNLILDEAHQLPEVASFHFGLALSSRRIKDLLQDISAEQKQSAKDVKQFPAMIISINRLLDQMQTSLAIKPERGFYKQLYTDPLFTADIIKLDDLLQDLINILEPNSTRSKGLEACYNRAVQLGSDLAVFVSLAKDKFQQSGHSSHSRKGMPGQWQWIEWYEIYKHNFMFKQSPLEVKELFLEKLNAMAKSVILTSATMSIAGDFQLIQNSLGLEQAKTMVLPSPFDYKNNALLYLPRGMPEPTASNYLDCYIEQILPVLAASRGRAFLLFTSFVSMHLVYERLTRDLGLDKQYNILMQGKASKSALLENFAGTAHSELKSILLATSSFWEGIDVKGEDLHCVIIDKLPFESIGDPMLQAKIKHLQHQGKNAFLELQCQQAALQLTQGAGRLIRSEQDYGVLMICDPRITSRSYGEVFLKSLPNMQRTRELSQVQKFYKNID